MSTKELLKRFATMTSDNAFAKPVIELTACASHASVEPSDPVVRPDKEAAKSNKRSHGYRVTFSSDMAERIERLAHEDGVYATALMREIVEVEILERCEVYEDEPLGDRCESALESLNQQLEACNDKLIKVWARRQRLMDRIREIASPLVEEKEPFADDDFEPWT